MKYKRIYYTDKEDYADMNKKNEIKSAIATAISAAGLVAVMKIMGDAPAQETAVAAMALVTELGLTYSMIRNFFATYVHVSESESINHGYTTIYDEEDLEKYRRSKDEAGISNRIRR